MFYMIVRIDSHRFGRSCFIPPIQPFGLTAEHFTGVSSLLTQDPEAKSEFQKLFTKKIFTSVLNSFFFFFFQEIFEGKGQKK